MHPDLKIYLINHGIKPDEDGYALSIFLQWIWRSAIRNGEEIYIYVPSSRMRRLLKEWIIRCEAEYHAFYKAAEKRAQKVTALTFSAGTVPADSTDTDSWEYDDEEEDGGMVITVPVTTEVYIQMMQKSKQIQPV